MEDSLYKENILDHYKNPHNFGKMSKPTFKKKEFNPLCGDEIELFVKFKGDKVSEVKFTGTGCAISQASISMLTDFIKGKTREDLNKLNKDDIMNLLGIKVGVVRMKCALLSLKTLQGGLSENGKSRN